MNVMHRVCSSILKWLLSAGSALILVLMVISVRRFPYWWWSHDLKTHVALRDGGIEFMTGRHPTFGVAPISPPGISEMRYIPRAIHWAWWFGHERWKVFNQEGWDEGWALGAPLWAPFLLFSAPSALMWGVHWRACHRHRRGLCSSCGYDRRGLVVGDAACPECGSKP